MALSLSFTASPVPPPHKAGALKNSISKTQPAATPPDSTQPQTVSQPETPETPAPVSPPTPPDPAPVAPSPDTSCVTGYFTGDANEDYIIRYESGGYSCATNYLGCFGLMQACPGTPLRDACGGNPVCQLNWFWVNKVANDPKYGSWAAVVNHELTYGWW